MKLFMANKAQWRDYTRQCCFSSIYQDPRWLELIESVYPKLHISRLVCKDEADRILWLLPLVGIKPLGRFKPMLISVPFGNYGGFIYPQKMNHSKQSPLLRPLSEFLAHTRAFAIEIRSIAEPAQDFYVDDQFKRFEVSLSGNLDSLWRYGITGNARTSVRKADKLGLSVIFSHERALDIFRQLYERHAAFHGTPIHHPRWFEEMTRLFASETEVILAKLGEKFIGALLILYHKDQAILHTAVTDPQYYRIPATDRMLWGCFEHIKKNTNIQSFDFGRTRPVASKIFFKRKWGGKESTIFYAYLVKRGESLPRILPENPKFSKAIWWWRHFPLFITRRIGPKLRPRIPT